MSPPLPLTRRSLTALSRWRPQLRTESDWTRLQQVEGLHPDEVAGLQALLQNAREWRPQVSADGASLVGTRALFRGLTLPEGAEVHLVQALGLVGDFAGDELPAAILGDRVRQAAREYYGPAWERERAARAVRPERLSDGQERDAIQHPGIQDLVPQEPPTWLKSAAIARATARAERNTRTMETRERGPEAPANLTAGERRVWDALQQRGLDPAVTPADSMVRELGQQMGLPNRVVGLHAASIRTKLRAEGATRQPARVVPDAVAAEPVITERKPEASEPDGAEPLDGPNTDPAECWAPPGQAGPGATFDGKWLAADVAAELQEARAQIAQQEQSLAAVREERDRAESHYREALHRVADLGQERDELAAEVLRLRAELEARPSPSLNGPGPHPEPVPLAQALSGLSGPARRVIAKLLHQGVNETEFYVHTSTLALSERAEALALAGALLRDFAPAPAQPAEGNGDA